MASTSTSDTSVGEALALMQQELVTLDERRDGVLAAIAALESLSPATNGTRNGKRNGGRHK